MSWRCVHCRCHDFRFYVTLFPKCFSNFRSRYLFAIGLPTLYLTLADTYLPLHTAFPSSATLLVPYHEDGVSGSTGYHRARAQYSHERLVQQRVCFAHWISPVHYPTTYRRFCHNSTDRFGNEFGPSSVAPDWGNHGCFLFLRWIICLSSAGSPATLRSVNQNLYI